jgi:hypothetical protein
MFELQARRFALGQEDEEEEEAGVTHEALS